MGRILAFISSFCVPVIGLMFFILWKNERPEDAKVAGIMAIGGLIINTAATLLLLTSVTPFFL